MAQVTKKPLKEALLEIARLVVFALPGFAILFLTGNPELAGAYGLPLLALLRAIDKAVHVADNDVKGITPF